MQSSAEQELRNRIGDLIEDVARQMRAGEWGKECLINRDELAAYRHAAFLARTADLRGRVRAPGDRVSTGEGSDQDEVSTP